MWRGGTFYNCCKRSFDEPAPKPEKSGLTTAASDTADAPAESGVEK